MFVENKIKIKKIIKNTIFESKWWNIYDYEIISTTCLQSILILLSKLVFEFLIYFMI